MLILFAKQFTSRTDAVLEVFTSVGRRFYYLQNDYSNCSRVNINKNSVFGWELPAAGGIFLEIQGQNLCKNTVFKGFQVYIFKKFPPSADFEN